MPYTWFKEGPVKDAACAPPRLLVINFSGGVQSTALVYMVLRGELPLPVSLSNVVVLTADPGMEMTGTYETVRQVQAACEEAGVRAYTVEGPSLYEDLTRDPAPTRLDNPPYFVRKGSGEKPGRLRQKCTRQYKIRPMNRAVRDELRLRGIPVRGPRAHGVVEKWIGFPLDEVHRFSMPDNDYERFKFPLADLRMTKADVKSWLEKQGLPVPGRSVCAACFANTPAFFCRMKDNDPEAWAKAVAVDTAVRRHPAMAGMGAIFVSDTMRPLASIVGSDDADRDELSCDTGYCFL